MKRILIPLILLSGVARAQMPMNQWKNLVVKTISYPCLTGTPRFEGSGLLIQTAKGTEVLTSEHVLLQASDQQICIDVQNAALGTESALLENASYMQGLGSLLLKNPRPAVAGLPLNQLPMNSLAAAQILSVSAIGFPRGSDGQQTLQNGVAINLQSTRALIPGAKSVGEFTHLPVEFGMSGGVLLAEMSPGQFQFLGVLSHQVLQRAQGQTTQVMSLTDQGKISDTDLALGILNSDVNAWMKQPAASLGSGNVWQHTLNVSGGVDLSAGPFNLQLKPINSNVLATGGADGSGIGGDDATALPAGQPRVIAIKLDKKSVASADAVIAKYPFFKKWRSSLLAGSQVTIVQLSKRLASGDYDVKPVGSLDQVLTLWMHDGYEPIGYVGDMSALDGAMRTVMANGVTVAQDCMRLQEALLGTHPQTAGWLEKIKQQAYLASNQVIPAAQMLVWTDDSQNGFWNDLMGPDQKLYDLATKLNTDLLTLSGN